MKFVRTAVAVFFVAAVVSTVSAQSGGLVIKVVDSNGDPLPGAVVTISHPTGYVAESAVSTNGNGIAEFPVLRPTGSSGAGYKISVVFPGFAPIALSDLKVRVSETNQQVVQMSDEIVERVKVTAKADVVDLDETSQSMKFSDEFIQDLPVPGRFYQNVLTLAPGVQDADGDGNPNVHGSRDRDFKTTVSGISNVDPLSGQQMSQVNPNSIEEMEVITAGAGVEFSRAQGGFATILQKQGTNEFEGVVELYWRSSKLDGDGADDYNNVSDNDFQDWQPSIQVSGPILKDKLWYRLSHLVIDREIPQPTTAGIAVVEDKQEVHADQLTWQVSPRNKLAFQFQADPRTTNNFGVSTSRPAQAALFREQRVETYSMTWTAPYSPKILVESRVGWQDSNISFSPTSTVEPNDCLTGPAFLELAQCFNGTTGMWSGSYFQNWDDHRQRMTVQGDATVFAGRFLGASHEFRLGLSVENERYTRDLDRRPVINFFVLSPSDDTEAQQGKPEQVGIIFGNFSAPQLTEITARGVTWGFYARDQFKPAQNLTVTLGMRVDREEIRSDGYSPFNPELESTSWNAAVEAGSPEGVTAQTSFTKFEAIRDFFRQLAATMQVPFNDLWTNSALITRESTNWHQARAAESIDTSNTNFSPRFALSWDPWSNAKTKIVATAGRYYDKIYLTIPLQELEPTNAFMSFEAEQTGNGFAYSRIRNSVNPAANIQIVDRDLKTPYQDEWQIGFEREIAQETSLSLTYINRRYRDQLQDFDLNHVPGDFGRCVRQESPTQVTIVPVNPSDPDYDPTYGPRGDGLIDDCIGELELLEGQGEGGGGGGTEPPSEQPVLQRPDGTADLYVQNPGWGNVYFISNVNEIDYDGYVLELIRRQYRSWEMQASYTWSRAFGNGEDFGQDLGDDRSLIDDEKGYQAYDQRHVVKVTSTTITPWGFRLGGSVSWQSGLPWSVLRRAPAYDAIPPAYQTLNPGSGARVRTTYLTGQRNDQRNDSYWNVDLRFSKEMNLGRNLNLQLSAEIFNLLNDGTYQIYDPLTEVGEQINGTNNAVYRFGRRWQLGVKMAF